MKLTLSVMALSVMGAAIGVPSLLTAHQESMMRQNLNAACTAAALASAQVISQSGSAYAINQSSSSAAINIYNEQWQLQNPNPRYVTPGPVTVQVENNHVLATGTITYVPFLMMPLKAIFPGTSIEQVTITGAGTARI